MSDTTTINDLLADFMATPSATAASKLVSAVQESGGSLVFKPMDQGARAEVMPFGKHKSKTLGDIAESDFDYLVWLSQEAEISKPSLKAAIDEVVNGSA